MKTRAEHIKWCKERAIQEMDFYKDPKQGIMSMLSDIRKHPETDSESLAALCMMTLQDRNLTYHKALEFINGFN